MTPAELSALKATAAANPDSPEALRLTWLKARTVDASRKRLLELLLKARARRWHIPEIDAYVSEQLASARAGLEKARASKAVSPAALRALEHAVADAERQEVVQRMLRDPTFAKAMETAEDAAKGTETLKES